MGGAVAALGKTALGGLAASSPTMQLLGSLGGGATANPFAGLLGQAGGGGAVKPVTTGLTGPMDIAKAAVQGDSGPRDYKPAIIQAAQKWGVDPNIALRVAKTEGGTSGWIQSTYKKGGAREPSYGPFQMLVGGEGTGFPEGMGNQFMRETGLDPRDEANAEAVLDFAMREASQKGWGQWYGAGKAGIKKFEGIGGPPQRMSPEPTAIAARPMQDAAAGAPAGAISPPFSLGASPQVAGGSAAPPMPGMPAPDQAPKQNAFMRVLDAMSQGANQPPQVEQASGMETSAPVDLGAPEIAELQKGLMARGQQASMGAQARKERLRAQTRYQV